MGLIKSRKIRSCKKCRKDIWPNSFYYPQRRGKAICIECKREPRLKGFIEWTLGKLK